MGISTETRVGIFVLGALALLFYMTIHVGSVRFNKGKYNTHIIYFTDSSGLEKRADVKIAGVTVGWVENITLAEHDPNMASAEIKVLKQHPLYSDAHAIVRQDGLIGQKYLELNPGNPNLMILPPNAALTRCGERAPTMEDVMKTMHKIAIQVEGVTNALNAVFIDSTRSGEGGSSPAQQLRTMIDKFSSCAVTLDRTLTSNEQVIGQMLNNINQLAADLRKELPHVSDDISSLSRELRENFLPQFSENTNRIAHVIETDFKRLTQRLETMSSSFEGAANTVSGSFNDIGAIASKIKNGDGLLGKLVTDNSMYDDIKSAVGSFKGYLNKMENIEIVLDSHSEFMQRNAERLNFKDAKGYMDIRIHTTDDRFYLFQIVQSQRGVLSREFLQKNWYDENGNLFTPEAFFTRSTFLPELIGDIETVRRQFDRPKFGLQFGKIFGNIALRGGLIEGFMGFGVDIEIPVQTDHLRWVTTFEAFDFRGRDRFNDSRPHLKWLNRVFLFRNIYATFGADDFLSRNNANAFFGGGVRFADDDLKYLASKIGLGPLSGGS